MSATEKECKRYICQGSENNQSWVLNLDELRFSWVCEDGVRINYNRQLRLPFSIFEDNTKSKLIVQRIGLKYSHQRGVPNSTVLETDSSFIEVKGTKLPEMTWCEEIVKDDLFTAIENDEIDGILANMPSVKISLRLR